MYKFWHDYNKSKYGDKAKLCYTDTGSFVVYIETEDFYEDIANDVKKGLIHLIMMKMMKDYFKQVRMKK